MLNNINARRVFAAIVVLAVLVITAVPAVASNPDKPYRGWSPLRAFGMTVRDGQVVNLAAEKIAYFRRATMVHWETSEWDFPENTAVLEEGPIRAFRSAHHEPDDANKVLVESNQETGQVCSTYTDSEVGLEGQVVSNDGWMGLSDTDLTLPGGPQWKLGHKAHFSASPNSAQGKAYLDQLEARIKHRQQNALPKSEKDLKKMDGDVDWRPSPFLKIFNLIAAGAGLVSNIWAGNKIGQGANARWTGLEGLRQTSAYMNAAREAFVLVGAWDPRYVNSAGTRGDQTLNANSGLALVKRYTGFEKAWDQIEKLNMAPQEYFERQRLGWSPNRRRRHKTPLTIGASVESVQSQQSDTPKAVSQPAPATPYAGGQHAFVHNPALQAVLASMRAKFEGRNAGNND